MAARPSRRIRPTYIVTEAPVCPHSDSLIIACTETPFSLVWAQFATCCPPMVVAQWATHEALPGVSPGAARADAVRLRVSASSARPITTILLTFTDPF